MNHHKSDHSAEKIAKLLISERGLDQAIKVVGQEIRDCHEQEAYYELSIWREVRMILER